MQNELLVIETIPEFVIEAPRKKHGDFAANIYAIGPSARMAPRKIAEIVVDIIKQSPDTQIERVEVIAGFINFFQQSLAYDILNHSPTR